MLVAFLLNLMYGSPFGSPFALIQLNRRFFYLIDLITNNNNIKHYLFTIVNNIHPIIY